MPVFSTDAARGHALFPDAVAELLPALYALDGQGLNAPVTSKLFGAGSTIFLTEFDGSDSLFGYICSPHGRAYDEWTYFSLTDLANALRTDLPGHPRWERDLYFTAGTPMHQALAQHYLDSGATRHT